jgi:DMSO/TMAO reductase YedYZ molybdopterin-dependent catalytic subunit
MAALPNADDPVTPASGTRLEVTPLEDHYRIDITTTPPSVEPEGYVLPFTTALTADGSVQTLAELTLDDIRNYEPTEAYITMSCISNPVGGTLISTIKWTGVSMQQLLADIDVPANATHINITGADGFDETIALDLINADERVMLTYEWEDQPLTVEHGFPLRIHIPDHYGMKQPKWITGMEFIAGDQDGYWVRRGWDKQALVLATSVVDTAVPMDAGEDEQQLVAVGGIAWAGVRGISKVEVRVDDGEWVEAQIRVPISDRTWQIWRYEWPFVEGAHTFEVRCVEGDGSVQIERAQGTFPSGATGIDSMREVL